MSKIGTVSLPSVSKVTIPKPKTTALPKQATPKAPQIKNTGLQGYLQASKMKPLVRSIKAQLMP